MRAVLLALAATLVFATRAEAAPTWLSPVTVVPPSAGDAVITDIAGNDAGQSTAVWLKLDASAPGCCYRVTIVQHSPGGGFSTPKPLSTAGLNADDPRIGIDAAGSATLVWSEYDGVINSIKAVSVDPGGNLGVVQTLSTAATDAIAPRVAVSAGGTAVATWLEGGRIRAAVRPAGASSFGSSDPISAAGTIDEVGDVAVDAAGDAIAAWVRNGVVEASRRPVGGSFQAVADAVSSASGTSEVVLAMTPSGRATAMWAHVSGEVQFAERTIAPDFAGGSWSASGPASPSDVTATSPSLALDDQNTAVAIWRANKIGVDFVQSGTRASGASFTGYQPLSGTSATGFASRVDIAPDGTAVAIWVGKSGAQPAIQAARRPPGGAFGAVNDLDLGNDATDPSLTLYSPRIAVDDQGNATAVWTRFRFSPPPPAGSDVNEWSVAVAGYDAAPPTLNAVSIPASGSVGAGIGMAAAATDRWSPFSLSWAFGDGTGATGPAVSHAYGGAGAFGVTVSATDAVGNASSASGQVLVSAVQPPITPRIDSTVQSKWGFDQRTGRRFYLFRLKVVAPPAGSVAQLRCRGRRCPFQSRRFTRIRRNAITLYKSVSAAKVVKKRNRRFRAGQTVQLRITAPGYIGKVVKYNLKRRKQPVGRVLCLPPGTTKPAKC